MHVSCQSVITSPRRQIATLVASVAMEMPEDAITAVRCSTLQKILQMTANILVFNNIKLAQA